MKAEVLSNMAVVLDRANKDLRKINKGVCQSREKGSNYRIIKRAIDNIQIVINRLEREKYENKS